MRSSSQPHLRTTRATGFGLMLSMTPLELRRLNSQLLTRATKDTVKRSYPVKFRYHFVGLFSDHFARFAPEPSDSEATQYTTHAAGSRFGDLSNDGDYKC